MHEEEFSGLKLKSFRVIETESIFSGGLKTLLHLGIGWIHLTTLFGSLKARKVDELRACRCFKKSLGHALDLFLKTVPGIARFVSKSS